jgi:hypothetical protein
VRVASGGGGGGGRDGAGAEHGRALQEVRRRPGGHVVLSAPGHVVGHVIGPSHVIAPCHVVGHVIGPGDVVLATPAHFFSGGGEGGNDRKRVKKRGEREQYTVQCTIVHFLLFFFAFVNVLLILITQGQ